MNWWAATARDARIPDPPRIKLWFVATETFHVRRRIAGSAPASCGTRGQIRHPHRSADWRQEIVTAEAMSDLLPPDAVPPAM